MTVVAIGGILIKIYAHYRFEADEIDSGGWKNVSWSVSKEPGYITWISGDDLVHAAPVLKKYGQKLSPSVVDGGGWSGKTLTRNDSKSVVYNKGYKYWISDDCLYRSAADSNGYATKIDGGGWQNVIWDISDDGYIYWVGEVNKISRARLPL